MLRELQYEKAVFNKAIPIPEVIEEPSYEYLYKTDFKLPKHYIRLKSIPFTGITDLSMPPMIALDFEDELPEYDLDEEDKEWLENSRLNVTSLKFEQIIEQLEKACCQKVWRLCTFHCPVITICGWVAKHAGVATRRGQVAVASRGGPLGDCDLRLLADEARQHRANADSVGEGRARGTLQQHTDRSVYRVPQAQRENDDPQESQGRRSVVREDVPIEIPDGEIEVNVLSGWCCDVVMDCR